MASFKEHLAWKQSYLSPESYEVRLQALRWYYDQGRKVSAGKAVGSSNRCRSGATGGSASSACVPSRNTTTADKVQTGSFSPQGGLAEINDIPSLGQADRGGPVWEQRLVARIRELHLAWSTEKTYRQWAWQLERYSRPKELEQLTHEDLRGWFSHLAVNGWVAVATQKQALNASVFLFREVFKREPGDFSDFVRANKHRNVPSVLTREECRKLFELLSGTTRLMAELMYGAGLRLSELLRLRVKDVDRMKKGGGGKHRTSNIEHRTSNGRGNCRLMNGRRSARGF